MASCPYAAFQSTLTTEARYCGAALPCVVDASCITTATVAATGRVRNMVHLGDLSHWPASRMHFDGSVNLSLVDTVLPAANVTGLYLTNCGLTDLPPSLVLPRGLEYLSLSFNNLTRYPSRLPRGLHALSLYGNQLTELNNLTIAADYFDAASNRIGSLTNVSFDCEIVKLGGGSSGNPISSLVNVTFSRRLANLDCGSCNVSNFVVDSASYLALSRAIVQFGAIAFNTTGCTAVGGGAKPLYNSSVCVTPSVRDDTIVFAASSASTSTLILVIVVLVVVLLGLALALFCLWKRRQSPPTPKTIGHLNVRAPNVMNRVSPTATAKLNPILEALASVRLPFEDVMLLRKLSEGAFGEVWKGTLHSEIVAVKKLLPHKADVEDAIQFIDEVKLMAEFKSPYIVALRGAAWNNPVELFAVIEYMDKGDLKDYLAQTTLDQVSWAEKLEILRPIGRGLAYLHERKVIHRDLKSRNVLLDAKKGAKLSDFGVSKAESENTMTCGVGTYRWMAPEVLQDSHYSVAADVYSFGMIIAEMGTHMTPYADLKNAKGQPVVDTAIMAMLIQGTIEPTFSDACPAPLRALATRCTLRIATDRPAAEDLVHELDAMTL
ncbi:TKL protein kinase [Saprolegnia parasitica CBS 223.65]|uniref:TKL protein kinase n=1 Tax=Saprolegnia parasitica (strain CBS 223.65) TaxID=695850 RepID=A0A067BYP0_SAPPC|nr:TKL protein kinase [Saprolegnia parasitica CBS 223.65]KDO21970.1 TKL protein kinase [Saprolegnia parasitica CBS 223.65]|eukprot:XP_012207312.1 TKL protein kinase [Saprolegnia parasitica CBS 223.65]